MTFPRLRTTRSKNANGHNLIIIYHRRITNHVTMPTKFAFMFGTHRIHRSLLVVIGPIFSKLCRINFAARMHRQQAHSYSCVGHPTELLVHDNINHTSNCPHRRCVKVFSVFSLFTIISCQRNGCARFSFDDYYYVHDKNQHCLMTIYLKITRERDTLFHWNAKRIQVLLINRIQCNVRTAIRDDA